MKKSRFTDEQIIGFLKQAEGGMPVKELCRLGGFSDATFYKWRAKFGGMQASEATRLREIEGENAKLKKLLAEAGYENGVGFPETTYLYNTDDKHQAVAEALQSMWKNVLGVEVTLNNQDWNVFLETRSKGDYSICRNGWIADYNDPVSFLDMFMTDNGNTTLTTPTRSTTPS